jgi:hypothetical protein
MAARQSSVPRRPLEILRERAALGDGDIEWAVQRIDQLTDMLDRVLPYVHEEAHTQHSALHDEAWERVKAHRRGANPR